MSVPARPKRLVYMAIDGVAPRTLLNSSTGSGENLLNTARRAMKRLLWIKLGMKDILPPVPQEPRWTSSVLGDSELHRRPLLPFCCASVALRSCVSKRWKLSTQEREEMEREQEKLRQDWEARIVSISPHAEEMPFQIWQRKWQRYPIAATKCGHHHIDGKETCFYFHKWASFPKWVYVRNIGWFWTLSWAT